MLFTIAKIWKQPKCPSVDEWIKQLWYICNKHESTDIPVFIAVLFTIAKIWKQPKCPSVDEWIKKLWCIYAVEYYSAVIKKKLLPFVTTWMDLEGIMLNKISQSEKDKYHMIYLGVRYNKQDKF